MYRAEASRTYLFFGTTIKKALVSNGVGKITVEDRPKPQVQDPSDTVMKLTRTTICGSDLYIIKASPISQGDRIIGNGMPLVAGVGVVESIGTDVKKFKVGDRVLIACITSCATCSFCKQGKFGLCNSTTGGWRLGHTHDGTQADYIKILHADASLHAVPKGVDERSLLVLSYIVVSGLHCISFGVLRGGVKLGCSVEIVGAGPVGLPALLTAQLYSPSITVMIDKDEGRLKVAKRMGATHTVNPDSTKDGLEAATKQHHCEIDGFNVVIEAVGVPATFSASQDLVGKGGVIANVGVHGIKVDLRLEEIWGRGIRKFCSRILTIAMALVNPSTLPMLMKLFEAGKLNTKAMTTHDFKFSEMLKAYDTFGKASETGALKVNIEM
ncbi:chaperonin 10-like protein [Rhexocercosporidium sp. MPI-PUGE-AT-0058]|nr:chaperonin 10-like protein [Rhexocercosporidium sp. MPI-PUGE-AT-0058]